MQRLLVALFSLVAYAVALLSLGSLATFLAKLDWPRSIDAASPLLPPMSDASAVAVNILLVLIFGVPHSVMARQGFKQWLKRWVPESAMRSVYVLVNSGCLALLVFAWQPLTTTLWQVDGVFAVGLWGLYGLGWFLVLFSSFLIDHWHLFGLTQAWRGGEEAEALEPSFRTPLLYVLVRHPMMTGMLLALWATPHMTAGHLLAAVGLSIYIFVGMAYEEKDLIRAFGETYRQYRAEVPMVLPWPKRRPTAVSVGDTEAA